MAKVKAILWVDEELLKEAFCDAHPDEEYELGDALESEMGWVEDSGISLGTYEVVDEEEGDDADHE